MQLRIPLVLLCCLAAAVIVQSETTIEVDENGDEYEVKRFNIEGRQLNGGNSQCVITRRKRSTAPAAASPSTDENVGNSGHQTLNTSGSKSRKSSKVDAHVQHDSDNDFGGVGLMENSNYGDNNYDDDYDYDGDDHDDGMQNNFQVPIIIHEEIVSPYLSQHVAAENLNGNGLFVIQTNEPPRVDPETHAIFELLPVNHAIHAVSGHKTNEYGELQFEEEISPVSTTGIWSTGDDNDNKRYDDELDDDYDDEIEELNDEADVDKKPSKPSKSSKPKKKKPSKNTAKRPNKNMKNRRRPSKKGPVRVNRNNKKKNRFSRPNKPYARRGNRRGSNRRKNANNNRFKYSNNRNRFNNNRRKNNKRFGLKGDDWLTKTETVTATGTADDDQDKNCIIIRKDPPATSTTTTARPFWNFLGRNGNSNSRQFGNRKRVNLRLVAKEE